VGKTVVSECRLTEVGISLGRVRCPTPAQVERMQRSLAAHGQLTPIVAIAREAKLELVDGFKRHRAAQHLGWETLRVTVASYDARGQWVAMLLLNQGACSMTALEEALVLRELGATGLTQVEMGQLLGRHKSWVSRRVGLLERLHPEVMESVKLGLMPAGAARRLLGLPQGNQAEFAAAIMKASLGPRETERLVSLWQKTSAPEVRRFLLKEPRQALANAQPPDRLTPADMRLSPRAQRLVRSLRILQAVALSVTEGVRPLPAQMDLEILRPDLRSAQEAVDRIEEALGFVAQYERFGESDATSETPPSGVVSTRATA
jgi:ParB/RepB/Spo0J family partition protein